jgi:hypothetical protein
MKIPLATGERYSTQGWATFDADIVSAVLWPQKPSPSRTSPGSLILPVKPASPDVEKPDHDQNLQDADQVVRLHAASILGSLGEIGPAAEEAIPDLFAAVDDQDESVAEMAEAALEQIDLAEGEAEAA